MGKKTSTLYRSEDDRMVAGIIAAFAERFGLDIPLARFAFAVMIIIMPQLIVAYLAGMLIIPEKGQAPFITRNDPSYQPKEEQPASE